MLIKRYVLTIAVILFGGVGVSKYSKTYRAEPLEEHDQGRRSVSAGVGSRDHVRAK